ncbi:Pentatricopeptide repeat-containing protein, mitochondrial [Vitis vinifera]|uniref:Pentatricopeptide repeat-containing protein, mitochondrial n=1 Tax=Vitis vinifera TaxID=29760 RepID=A0A438JBZ4_VITVI|nr:Pentatricopeptide repeat-containing protein, mitochondrial [Vitis vinifera]
MYIKCSDLEFAFKVFDGMPQRDTVSWNAMLFGYAGRGDIGVAQKLFDAMPERDVVSWNSLISGYLHNGDHRKVIDVFLQMGRMGTVFDRTTFAVVLKSCSSLEDHGGGSKFMDLQLKWVLIVTWLLEVLY